MQPNQKKKLTIGVSDFKKLITNDMYFIDKSLFIKDVVDDMEVLLYPRPRRFGKTLNLSMLKYFSIVKRIIRIYLIILPYLKKKTS